MRVASVAPVLLVLVLVVAASAAPIKVSLRKMPVDSMVRQHHANKSQLLTFQPQDVSSAENFESANVPITNFMDAQVSSRRRSRSPG